MATETMDVKKGNFEFVKEIYPDIYELISDVEKLTYTDCKGAGQELRNSFEKFVGELAKEFGIATVDKNGKKMSLFDCTKELRNSGKFPNAGKYQYMTAAHEKKEGFWDYIWREYCNQCDHEQLIPEKPDVSSSNLEVVLHAVYAVFLSEYKRKKGKDAAKAIPQFNTQIIPIKDNYVIDSYTPLDKPVSNCVREYETCSYGETGRVNKYGIVRMFKKKDIDEKLLLLRDQEAFSEAESEAGIQFDGNVQVEALSKIGSQYNEYYVVIYKFTQRPSRLNDKVISALDISQRVELCKKIARILNSFHTLSTPIYHRNLSFDSIYVCKNKKGILEPTIIKLDCAKIESDEFGTVIANVQNMQTMIQQQKLLKYSAPEVRALFQGGNVNVNWDKADVFSLGVLFGDILNGQIDPGPVPAMKLQRAGVNMSLIQLIDKMKNPNADLRPNTSTIINYLEEME